MRVTKAFFDQAKRVLALLLAVAILAGIVFANDLTMARTLSLYRELEEYQYLIQELDYTSQRWLKNLLTQLTTVFYSEKTAVGSYRRACVKFNRGDLAGAIPYMTAAIELTPENERAELLLEKACLSYLVSDVPTAHECAAQAAQLVPEDLSSQWYRYKYASAAGDVVSQAKGLGAYARMHGGQIFLQEAGRLNMAIGEFEEAQYFYHRTIEEFGGNDELHYMRGSCLMLTGQYEEAIGDFKKSSFNGSLYSLGACELALGHTQSAALYFETSMERNEHVEDSRLMLAACTLELGNPAEAEKMLNTYIDNGGAYESAAYYRASARAMQNNFEGAIEDYDASLIAGTFPEDSLFGAAQCRYFAGRFEEAADLLSDCIDRGVHPSESRYFMGMTLMELGRDEEARSILKEALSMGSQVTLDIDKVVNEVLTDPSDLKQTEVGNENAVENEGKNGLKTKP